MDGGYNGRRGGGQPRERGGGGQERRVLWENETTPQMTSDLHPTAHNPFLHPRTEGQFLINIFLGYYTVAPLKIIGSRIRPLQEKRPRYPI
jgi:hypothetical protein